MVVVERANGSKELIDNQVNDDEIEQADARNKNNDWREKQIMLTCKGALLCSALTMIIYLLRSHDSLLWHAERHSKSRHIYIMRRRMFSLNWLCYFQKALFFFSSLPLYFIHSRGKSICKHVLCSSHFNINMSKRYVWYSLLVRCVRPLLSTNIAK